MTTGPKILSLCTGYGGLDMGLEAVTGGYVSHFAEIEDSPAQVFQHHNPDAQRIKDIRDFDWTSLSGVDILTAGYPCQPFSKSGHLKGTDDPRHLWPYVREAIRTLRPRLSILENVSNHRKHGFAEVLRDLAEDGFHVRWVTVRASHVGAPHHRERLFIAVFASDPDAFRLQAGRVPRRARSEVPELTFCEDVLPGWESTVGPAPRYSNSGGKLNLEYVEWMMGLPKGHVTDPAFGFSRKRTTEILGNGVVPQQAQFAIETLLTGIDIERMF